MAKILVTGAAGFIGFHLVNSLLKDDNIVAGLDNLNDYYDVQLKYNRLLASGIDLRDAASVFQPEQSATNQSHTYTFHCLDLTDRAALLDLFARERFDYVVHLAAQAGVRYSLTHPQAYVDANITGFLNILEACRAYPVKHLVYASSSSVYGKNTDMPFSVNDNVDHPVSLYAASKKSNELMAHTYSHLFGIPATGLRFFTVYGPWGRPDMALFLFTKAILAGEPIKVYNRGNMMRDFTYIDDIVEGINRIMVRPAVPNPDWSGENPDPASSNVPHKVYNIGRGQPIKLMAFIEALENALGTAAEKMLMPMQPGDVPATWADTTALELDAGYKPDTPVEVGIKHFVDWYKTYYGI
ncbi:MAG: NAD-dependent epimerase [Bacteroidales bacterium]